VKAGRYLEAVPLVVRIRDNPLRGVLITLRERLIDNQR
jgi:hypothetical protein